MRVFLSVVSHKHAELIIKLGCLEELSSDFTVVLKNNFQGDSVRLNEYCRNNNIYLIDHSYGSGFGSNNNIVFKYCEEKLNISGDDYFITLNPDVVATVDEINNLITTMQTKGIMFSAISLYKDSEKVVRDYSVRKFPTFPVFVKSLLGFGNSTIITNCDAVRTVDWAAGSFLAFKASLFKKLKGFDERYFMYCEDIDICYRAQKLGQGLTFLPHISAIHLAKHQNRKVFSKHFYWHVKSAMTFLLLRKISDKTISII